MSVSLAMSKPKIMSKRADESPAPDVPQEIYDMQNEILGTFSETDFCSDDLGNDPSYVPKKKSSLRNYYETACNVLISSPEMSGSVLRELPSDISSSSYSESPLSRKRKRNTELWKQNIRKNLHDRGLPFVNSKGVERPGRALGPVCSQSCYYTCTTKVSEDERQDIHSHFWSLSSSEKQIFYGNFVKKVTVKHRRENWKKQDQPRKKSSFHFYLKSNNKTVQVCKKYFLNTLSISERVIYSFFAKHYEVDTVEAKSKLKDCGKKPTEEEHRIIEVKTHISSFPTVDSHYCRSTTSRKYLEAHLSVQKMFDLYKISTNNPVSINIYRKVFNTSFNLSFYAPRKNICDKCHIFKVNAGKQSEAEILLHQKHLDEKRFTKAERDADLQNIDNNSAVLIYDLENVFALPKMFASSFYYKRKLSVYNLTGTLIIPNQEKVTYCALWNETLSGRSGNDIASVLIKILSKVATDHPSLNTITLWSDSCVPQNRNRVTATALLQFIHDNPKMEEITPKFSKPVYSKLTASIVRLRSICGIWKFLAKFL